MTVSVPPATRVAPASVGMNFLKLGSGELVARVIAFCATVYLARTLGASMYGVVVLATTLLLYLTVLTDAGVDALGVREVASRPTEVDSLVPAIVGARVGFAAVLVCIVVVAGLTVVPQPDGAIIAIYACTLPVAAMGTRWAHLGLGQSGYASAARVLSESISTLLVVAVVRGPGDLARIPVTQLVGEACGTFVLLRLLPVAVRRARLRWGSAALGGVFRESWPIMVHSLLGLAIFNLDFIFLRAFHSSATVGTYAAAYTLISFFVNLGAAYTLSMLPVITRVRHDPAEARMLFESSMAQVMSLAAPVAVGGFLVADAVVGGVFGSLYSASALPLGILIWSIPFALTRNVAQATLVAFGRQDKLMRTAWWAVGCNVGLNLVLIPRWGVVGAAVATVLTEAVRTVLALRYTRALGLPMLPPRRFWRIAVACVVMGATVSLLGARHLVILVGMGALSYAAALVVLGIIRIQHGRMPIFAP